MTYYEFLVFLHVLAAIVWVGGAAALQVQGLRAQTARDPLRLATVAGEAEWIGSRVFMPASLVVILTGVLGVVEADFDWGSGWISTGFGVWILSFLVGMGFLGPESGRIRRLIASEGPEGPAVQARIRRVLVVSRVELVLFVIVVWAMVAKPGL